ncbi:MAG: UDP-N-acetylmuramoyl-L-alanyl-D-glutamate--2,6-diaminopimelate ligase [Desulfobulbus sp.]|nr:UDP-N-acetylmuramoyl-L-alanyl-D-glutamate--2,6-diaminopimelate ligase [Desulfobulbus sp.]
MHTLATLLQTIEPLETRGLTAEALAQPVTSVVLDSRQVKPGCLFVAVCGDKIDGRTFIPEAIRRGCVAVVVEDMAGIDAPSLPLILVEDSQGAVGDLAAAWCGYPAQKLQLIGITGTNGKTTSSWLIEGMLLAAGARPGVIGTVNYRYHGRGGLRVIQDAPLTTPDAVTLQSLLQIMVDDGVTHVIMEVSSHALHQNRLGRTRFDVALFTNLSRDHLDYHQSMEAYFSVKKLLFTRYLKQNGIAVVVTGPHAEGRDWGEALCQSLKNVPLLRCGLSSEVEVNAQACTQTIDGFQCRLDLQGEVAEFTSPLTGSYNILNVLAAAGVGMGLGVPTAAIRKGLGAVARVPGRLERVRLPGTAELSLPSVFVDYAHTPDALENVLQTLKTLASGRLICVFGCGGDRDRGKRPLMGEIAGQYADVAIVTSDNPRSEDPESIIAEIIPGIANSGKPQEAAEALLTRAAMGHGFAAIANRHEAIRMVCSLAATNDSILIAGKGHENYQIVGGKRHFFDDCQEAANGLLHWNERHLLAATGGKMVSGRQHALLGQISTDTRTIGPGDIFVALKGEAFDGHQYIDKAVTAGARAIIGEWIPDGLAPDVLAIEVNDSLVALGDLAGYRRRLLAPKVRIAAITGSSGKTSVKEMVAAIFSQATAGAQSGIDPVLKTKGNFNNLVGLPLSLLPIEYGHELAVLEMGMNVPGEIARLTHIADPDIGCINNVHPAHLQGLGSIEGVAAAKGELFAGMRPDAIRIVNLDDAHVREQAKKSGGKQIGFAVSPSGRKLGPLVRATRQENLGELGMRFTLHIGEWQQRITVPVYGEHNVSNCAAATAIAHAAGIPPEVIVLGLTGYQPSVDKRLAVSVLPGGIKVVNDAYNANPASMAAGLRTVASFGQPGCRHLAALGDMLELGEASDMLHGRIGALVAELGYDGLAVTGPHASLVAEAALAGGMNSESVHIFADHAVMANWFLQLIEQGLFGSGDWLLIKGSRGMRMERLLEAMEQR